MSKKYDKKKYLKDKKIEGEMIKDPLPEGKVLMPKKPQGDPLWKSKESLNEKKKYKKDNLNEEA